MRTTGLIKLLPARPEKWASGKVAGICCRGGVTVDMAWDFQAGTLSEALTSQADQGILLQLPTGVDKARFEPGAAEPQAVVEGGYQVSLGAGEALQLTTTLHAMKDRTFYEISL
ncbi:MAG: hypothetical protein QGG69_07830 [Kiritimatiellia bacterium]|jgi:hypothetical protein|nr:hypothetical protein [Kiritimatiellia bacterium]MDP6630623.1 hypothetical protein [Kiritimatiellia bacterium]